MKKLLFFGLLVFCVGLEVYSQDLKYVYVHGKNLAGTADSVLYCGTIAKIDSIDIIPNTNPPTIKRLSKSASLPGTTVEIWGDNFPSIGDVKVYFGTTEAVVVSSTYTSIIVTVPSIAFDNVRSEIKVKKVSTNQESTPVSFIAWDASKVFADNFNRANTALSDSISYPNTIGTKWQILNGKAQISYNVLSTTESAKILFVDPAAIATPSKKFNFSCEVNFTSPSAVNNLFAGIFFDVQPNGTEYKVLKISSNYYWYGGYTKDNGLSWVNNFVQSANVLTNYTKYRFELSSQGTNIVHFKLVKSATGAIVKEFDIASYTSSLGGRFGFWNSGNYGKFDNFSLIVE